MKQALILLAGYPGTGKTYMANMLLNKFKNFEVLSPDKIKEEFWDAYGFCNEEEKEKLIKKSWNEYYQRLNWKLERGYSLISDYPFSDKQHDEIQGICGRYCIEVITIRMVGDLDVLFKRQKKRDLDDSRHLGHILKEYHQGTCLMNHEEADNLLDNDEFIKRCKCRGYGTFELGTTIELDVTDFTKVSYDKIMNEIALILN
ncbi:AAA family ATPase [Amedibacillus dolichus]|uniref:Kinase n=1 Tax=Amedibacillus dolichus DSM 3991 TaxID=428127 RepID=A8RA02_9FIRM|nr:AAA family ATPase [Amedibacillus dolichus]EDP11488.1 hypothetical protein EUBDOL_00666 [Amedibacillus dolichus DSM 3991]